MGFLLGAFGKLAAGRRVRALQAQMMRIQARARRATRDVADMTKLIDRQEKTMLNNLSVSSNYANQYAAFGLQASIFNSDKYKDVMSKINSGSTNELTENERLLYSQAQSELSQQSANMKMMCEQNVAMQKQQIQDYFEMLRETQLEPLKDEEEMLQTEKDSLESQIQVAQADYEACKKMEQSDAKNLAPSYTAG